MSIDTSIAQKPQTKPQPHPIANTYGMADLGGVSLWSALAANA